jgi:ankyrin repeat protein
LHCASQEGKLEAVRSLIRAGADVNLAVANKFGDSPIIRAATKGHAAVIKALAEAGADVNFLRAGDGASALVMASQQGHEAAVRVLLSLGADPRLACTNGATALALAKHCNHPAIAALL